MKRQISTTGAKPSTIAEEAVDQLQENEKLVAGMNKKLLIIKQYKIFEIIFEVFNKNIFFLVPATSFSFSCS